MRPAPLPLLAVLIAGSACSRPASTSEALPSRVVTEFYTARIQTWLTGAPTPSELARIAPFLSDTLRALLAAADRQREADLKRAPDDKPAFAEGDLFSSLFEGPTTFRVVEDSAGTSGRVPVRFTYADGRDTTTWTDAVAVGREHDHYVIADIAYGGTWAFANTGSLRTSLEQTLAPAARR